MMNCVLKTRNCVSKTRNFALNMMNFAVFVFNFGFRSGGGLADVVLPPSAHKYSDDYYEDWQSIGNAMSLGLVNWLVGANDPGTESKVGYMTYILFRGVFDISFFMVFVLFFSNVILVVMVDGLNDYREAVDDRKREISSHCIICAQHRDKIEAAGVPFRSHTRREHNVFMYLDLVASIVAKPLTEYTGAENYIAHCLTAGNWDFIPFNTSLCVDRAAGCKHNGNMPQNGNTMDEVMLGMRNLEAQMQKLLAPMQEAKRRVAAPAAGSDSTLDAEAMAWLGEKGLSVGPFAAVMGDLCTNLADMAMVTQADLTNLASLEEMEKRRLITALATLPRSALSTCRVVTGGEAPAEP